MRGKLKKERKCRGRTIYNEKPQSNKMLPRARVNSKKYSRFANLPMSLLWLVWLDTARPKTARNEKNNIHGHSKQKTKTT